MNDRWLAEVQAYDTTNGILTTLFFATQGFTSAPTDTYPSEFYSPVMKSPGNLSRSMFAGPATTKGASRVGLGDIVLSNGDGALNYLRTWGLDGRTITVKRTETYKMNPVYSDFSTVFVATMQQAEVGRDQVRIKLRDLRYSLKQPLQTTKYAGSGGLEGGADIKDKEKPVTLGAPHNVTPVNVNGPKLIWQVHDGALQSIDAVYDRGISLAAGLALISRASGAPASTYRAVCYGDKFVATGLGQNTTSSDGITWTARTQSGGTGSLRNCVAYNGTNLYVAAGDGSYLETSPDGITWTVQSTSFGANSIRGVVYGGTLWVAVGAAGLLETSPDGITWTPRTSSFASVQISGVAYGAGVYVAVASDGTIASSANGTAWTQRGSGVATALQAVYYGPGGFVATGAAGVVLTSPDGLVWSPQSTVDSTGDAGAYGVGTHIVATNHSGGIPSGTTSYLLFARSPLGPWTHFGIAVTDIAGLAYGTGTFAIMAGTAIYTTTPAGLTYASSADLLDDTLAPALGTYKVFLDATGSYFRLGAMPAGQITCDPVEGANAAARTAGQVFAKLLTRKSLTAYAADVTALDVANAGVVGFYQGPEPTNVDECCDDVLGSIGASWYIDASGNFRSAVFTGPAATTVRDFTPHDLKVIERSPVTDPGAGIPAWRSTVFYDRNYTVQTSDLSSAVSVDRRNFLAQEWRTAKDSDSAILTKHLLSPEFTMESLLTDATVAGTEATRQLTLRKPERDRFRLEVELRDENLVADLATTISVQHAMTGGTLAAPETHRYVVLGSELITDDPADRRLAISCWGPE